MKQRKRFSVRTLTAAEAVATLPTMRDFDGYTDPIDMYILSAGFEERVLAIPDSLLRAGSLVRGPILLGRYRTNPEDNAQREAELKPRIDAFAAGDYVPFDADSPESTSSVIKTALADKTGELHIAFDISGASSTLILSVIAALLRSGRKMRLSIFYATAAKYHEPSDALRQEPPIMWGDSDFSEIGVSEVEVNELYPGRHHDHLPTFVIALPSTAPARMKRCLGHLGVEPLSGTEDRVHWILPKTDIQEHKWRQNAVRQAVLDVVCGESHNALRASDGADAFMEPSLESIEYIDVGNYRECARLLIEKIDEKAGHNISIVHLGTKVQGVGVALAMAAREEVALVSARPQAFAASTYSDGVGSMFALTIDDPVTMVQHLSAIGTLKIEAE